MPRPKKNHTRPVHRYALIPRTLCFITNSNHLLLLKGAPTKSTWPNLYNGIGGHVERGESIEHAALREIQEETGLTDIADLRLRGTITIDTSSAAGLIVFVFTGSSATRDVHPSPEGQLQWAPMQAIALLPCVEDLPDLLSQINHMAELDPPFHLHYSQGQAS